MKKMTILTMIVAIISISAVEIMACAGCGCQAKKKTEATKVKFINKADVQKMIKDDKNLVIIDVLSPASYAKAHIKGAISIPLGKLHNEALIKTLDKNKTYIVYCASKKCKASTKAAKILLAHGFKKVFDYENGIAGWQEAKLPTETAKLCKCGAAKGSPTCCK